MNAQDAGLGSRPGLVYLEHKQNAQLDYQSFPREQLVYASVVPADRQHSTLERLGGHP